MWCLLERSTRRGDSPVAQSMDLNSKEPCPQRYLSRDRSLCGKTTITDCSRRETPSLRTASCPPSPPPRSSLEASSLSPYNDWRRTRLRTSPARRARQRACLSQPPSPIHLVWRFSEGTGFVISGIHTPLISEGLFERVYEVFRIHDRAGVRRRGDPHYLRAHGLLRLPRITDVVTDRQAPIHLLLLHRRPYPANRL